MRREFTFTSVSAAIYAGSQSDARMEHVTRSTALMDRMEDQLTGPDILMKDGDLGGEEGIVV